jgi:hypothetical protein
MDFQDLVHNNAEFIQWECEGTSDDNRVIEDTEITIKVVFKPWGYYAMVTFYCMDVLQIGTDLGSDDVWSDLTWHALELLDLPKFAVGKV